jgi:hypothetical protein
MKHRSEINLYYNFAKLNQNTSKQHDVRSTFFMYQQNENVVRILNTSHTTLKISIVDPCDWKKLGLGSSRYIEEPVLTPYPKN